MNTNSHVSSLNLFAPVKQVFYVNEIQLLDTEGPTLHIFVYDTRLYAIQWLVASNTENFLAAKIHHTFHLHYES